MSGSAYKISSTSRAGEVGLRERRPLGLLYVDVDVILIALGEERDRHDPDDGEGDRYDQQDNEHADEYILIPAALKQEAQVLRVPVRDARRVLMLFLLEAAGGLLRKEDRDQRTMPSATKIEAMSTKISVYGMPPMNLPMMPEMKKSGANTATVAMVPAMSGHA